MDESLFTQLDQSTEKLLFKCKQLHQENMLLRQRNLALSQALAALKETQKTAALKVRELIKQIKETP